MNAEFRSGLKTQSGDHRHKRRSDWNFWGRVASAEGGKIEVYGEGCSLPSRRPSIFCVLICVCIAYSGRLQTLSSIPSGPA